VYGISFGVYWGFVFFFFFGSLVWFGLVWCVLFFVFCLAGLNEWVGFVGVVVWVVREGGSRRVGVDIGVVFGVWGLGVGVELGGYE
jgi:hypothetical protein